MEVCEAENGAEGVQNSSRLESRPGYFGSLSMPVMNGLEAARALQLTMPHVPLLMFTNNAGAAIEKEARHAGIFAVVSKSEADSSEQLMAQQRRFWGWTGQMSKMVRDKLTRDTGRK
jgi:CheY-like chemotaxis protein